MNSKTVKRFKRKFLNWMKNKLMKSMSWKKRETTWKNKKMEMNWKKKIWKMKMNKNLLSLNSLTKEVPRKTLKMPICFQKKNKITKNKPTKIKPTKNKMRN